VKKISCFWVFCGKRSNFSGNKTIFFGKFDFLGKYPILFWEKIGFFGIGDSEMFTIEGIDNSEHFVIVDFVLYPRFKKKKTSEKS
jgi:hypothetical protein